MDIAFGRAAVAHVAEARAPIAAQLHRHRDADRVRDLRRHARRHHDVVMIAIARMTRHLATLGDVGRAAEHLRDVAVERHAAIEANAGLAQCRNDPIVGLGRRGRTDDRGLLAHRFAVEADPTLAM